jgi:hypothetical protein
VVVNVTFGDDAPAPPAVTPEAGYEHTGWSDPIPATVGVGDREFTAQYAPLAYTWTFHPGEHGTLDAGTPDVVVNVTFGDDAPAPPAVTPEAGYEHTGWSDPIPATVGVGNREFTAQYAPLVYTWTFHPGEHGALDEGTPDVVVNVTFGDDAPAPPAVTPEAGYEHTGWSDPIPATVGVGDREFTAQYAPLVYTWTFHPGEHGALDEGTPDVVVTVTFGDDAPAPPAVTPEPGYGHTGWADAIPATVGVGDREFTAQYAPLSYTWTFHPGEHGTLDEGTPDVVVNVTFGDDAPAPPVVTPEAGYEHTGWADSIPATVGVGDREFTALYGKKSFLLEVQNGSGSGMYEWGVPVQVKAQPPEGRIFVQWTVDPPDAAASLGDPDAEETVLTMPMGNTALTAVYGFAPPLWRAELLVDGSEAMSLAFGMHEQATDGWDEGLDEEKAMPGTGQAALVTDDLNKALAVDFRGEGDEADFTLIAHAGDTPLTVSWNTYNIPEGHYLTIYQVRLPDPLPARAVNGITPLGGTAADLADIVSVTVPAGETRGYILHYGKALLYDLKLEADWNLVSLPIDPVDPAADALIGQGTDADGGVRQGTLRAGAVWGWNGTQYMDVTEIVPCVGYWIFVTEPMTVLVPGLPVDQTALVLAKGWTLCGTARRTPVPDDERIRGLVWFWDAVAGRFRSTQSLLPGRGLWINASEDSIVPLDNR